MAIIVSCVAAVLVIIGLVWFNVRHATAEKEEIKEELSHRLTHLTQRQTYWQDV